jgi:hypothetical protein
MAVPGAGRSRSCVERTFSFFCLFVCLLRYDRTRVPQVFYTCPQGLLWGSSNLRLAHSALVPSFMLVANADGARNACFLP